jgi:hypothetical protein
MGGLPRAQNRVVDDIIRRAGLDAQEYLQSGHPDALFRDGVRREIKGADQYGAR